MTRYQVRFTPEAEADLLHRFDCLLEQDVAAADEAGAAIANAVELLEVFPFTCRKALGGDGNPFLRELIIPFGASGYVALFEIENRDTVTALAVRHQRKEDYHRDIETRRRTWRRIRKSAWLLACGPISLRNQDPSLGFSAWKMHWHARSACLAKMAGNNSNPGPLSAKGSSRDNRSWKPHPHH